MQTSESSEEGPKESTARIPVKKRRKARLLSKILKNYKKEDSCSSHHSRTEYSIKLTDSDFSEYLRKQSGQQE